MNPLYMKDLEEMNENDITEEIKQRFAIVDLASLSWGLRKLRAIEAKRNEVNALIQVELERLEQFRKSEMDGFQRSEDFFRGLIGEYALKRRDEDPKFKSEKTPYGSIGFRKQQPKWAYDDAKLVAFLNENELYDFVRVKEEPNKTEIKKLFKVNDDGKVFDPDGQAVDGIMVEFLPETLDVKVEL